jgi:hypothetical protein
MCIIIVKNRGVLAPSQAVIEQCFKNNPDGAGFMYYRSGPDKALGEVVIRKGYMTAASLMASLEHHSFKQDDVVIYHFRIGTSGKNNKATCHPYPVSDVLADLKSTRFSTDIGVAHNGILSLAPRQADMNDTQEFIMSMLSRSFMRPYLMRHVKSFTDFLEDFISGSRLALLDNRGKVRLYGKGWITEEETELVFSNSGYKPYTYSRYYDCEFDWEGYTGETLADRMEIYREDLKWAAEMDERDIEEVETALIYLVPKNLIATAKEILDVTWTLRRTSLIQNLGWTDERCFESAWREVVNLPISYNEYPIGI